jgi:hypothetical protein
MAFSSYVTVNPHHMVPGLIIAYSQKSGAFETLAGSKPKTELDTGDLQVYARTLDIRTAVSAGQSAYNQLASPSLQADLINTATYLARTRVDFDHHDTAAAGAWGVPLYEAYRKAMRQGVFQFMRLALLYGVTPSQGEGLTNAVGATAVNFPADPNSHTTLITMDNGWIAQTILQQIANLETRIQAVGQGALRVVVLAPQRVISLFNFQIVQLTSYQRPGAGSNTISGTIEDVGAQAEVEVIFAVDDTLIGKGAGGNDLIVITAPEIINPQAGGEPNTNEFGTLQPGLLAANMMYTDMDAPREIPTPIPGGGLDVVAEQRITSGWGIRPEATTLLSVQYS